MSNTEWNLSDKLAIQKTKKEEDKSSMDGESEEREVQNEADKVRKYVKCKVKYF